MMESLRARVALSVVLIAVLLLSTRIYQYDIAPDRLVKVSMVSKHTEPQQLKDLTPQSWTWGQQPQKEATAKRVAIIGAAGYVGARLHDYLNVTALGWVVHGYDRDPRGLAARVQPLSALGIADSVLKEYNAFVYLGGYTGRVMCDGNPIRCEEENVDDVVAFAKRLTPQQLLVFASTSAIAEGSGEGAQKETDDVQQALLDSYSSSMFKRERALEELSKSMPEAPQMVGIRFGTVVGLSPSQRTDLIHMALVCSAYGSGRLKISYPGTHRAMLAIDDLVVGLHKVLQQPDLAAKFEVFHLTSFNTNVGGVAHEVAQQTGAHIDVMTPAPARSPGFSLDSTKFQTRYHFNPQFKQQRVVLDLVQHVPDLCVGRDITHRLYNASVPCVVCGSTDMATVLDLASQPLANDFFNTRERAQACERYPLKLMHCRQCHHAQLSYLVDRERLFVNYQYQSGTSSTLAKHFETIVDKVVNGTGKRTGTVLEIASNDGTQLDKFKARGWRTYGVDPAKNLVKLAAAKGHTAIAAFWGQGKIHNLPAPSQLDAIVAQNVFAHVFKPVEFLKSCVEVMGPRTLLYVQTSQCEMFQSGQFDTVYHEHVSFFSAHSFQWAANAAGLSVVNMEIVPIHGRSCLVTLKRGLQPTPQSLQESLQLEVGMGMTQDWFYKQFSSRAIALRDWINGMLAQFASRGYTIGAYGAAAKGMVLLHFLKSSPASHAYEFAFVVDDAPLKQNTFCPGTTIPVKPTSHLKDVNKGQPLVLVIFAWNFEEEIVKKIQTTLAGTGFDTVLAIVPFPTQRVIRIHVDNSQRVTELVTNPAVPLPWPGTISSAMRCPVVGVTHIFNEELFLPFFIRHYAPMFDSMVIIDYGSTDKSIQVLNANMPASWRVVQSGNTNFSARAVDAEVVQYERALPACAWRIALTVTEFIIHPNLRGLTAEMDGNNTLQAIRFPAHIMVGDDGKPFDNFTQLPIQRSQYAIGENTYGRFLHRSSSLEYSVGRHSIVNVAHLPAPSGCILKYQWTPWPEILPRKLQIKQRIPQDDVNAGFGSQHIKGKEDMTKMRQEAMKHATADLSVINMKEADRQVMEDAQLWYATTYGNVSFAW